MTIENAILALTIGAIFSNLPHQYYTFNSFSAINWPWLRVLQNIVFCGLISFGILVYTLMGQHVIAGLGALVEIVINIYYYDNQFRERKRWDRISKNWAAYLFAVIIPSLILLFSYTYSQLLLRP